MRSRRERHRWGLFPVVSALVCVHCTQEQAAGSGSAQPQLLLEPSQLDLGELEPGQKVSRSLRVTSNHEGKLRLSATFAGPRCRGVVTPEVLAKGQIALLKVDCQTELLGPFQEQAALSTDAVGVKALRVALSGKVVPQLALSTHYVDFNLQYGESRTEDVTLVGKLAQSADITLRETGDKAVRATWVKGTDGAAPRIRLTCNGAEVGMHAGSVILTAALEKPMELALSWGCKVPGTLSVEPSNPYFNLKVSGDKALTVAVLSTQPDFKLHAAKIIEGPFIATLKPKDSEGTFHVEIAVKNEAIPDEARAATGSLLLLSNDKREPRKVVPLTGFGHINKVPRPDSTAVLP